MLFNVMLFFTRLKNKVRYFKHRKVIKDIDLDTEEGSKLAVSVLFSDLPLEDQKQAILIMRLRRAVDIVPALQNRTLPEYKTPKMFERFIMSENMSKSDWDFINQIVLATKDTGDVATNTLLMYQQFDGFTDGQCRYFNHLLAAGFND